MTEDNQAFVKLQKHLDKQAVGFPATRSGVEIKLLQHIFTPEEAGIACCLSYKYESLETIFHRAGHLVESAGELEQILERIQKKGGIESKVKLLTIVPRQVWIRMMCCEIDISVITCHLNINFIIKLIF